MMIKSAKTRLRFKQTKKAMRDYVTPSILCLPMTRRAQTHTQTLDVPALCIHMAISAQTILFAQLKQLLSMPIYGPCSLLSNMISVPFSCFTQSTSSTYR